MDVSAYTPRSRFWVQEFLVDLLGCLVPGFIFLFFATIVIIWPFVRIYGHLIRDAPPARTQGQTTPERKDGPASGDPQNKPPNSTPDQTAGGKERTSREACKSLSETFGTEMVILAIALSYAIGFLFLSADPRLPDARSVWANRKRLLDDKAPAIYFRPDVRGDCRLVRRPAIDVVESFLGMRPRYVGQLEKERKIDVEFPYLNIKYYLAYRNLTHLAGIIPWDARDKRSWRFKTTAFINMLKTRLGYTLPDKCSCIMRNEAHIRLMSSVWYMARLVQWLALVSIGLVVLTALPVCLFCGYAPVQRWGEVSVPCLGSAVLIAIAMWYTRARIELNLHYQRVREILYVLEMAHFATVCEIWEGGRKTKYPEILRHMNGEEGGPVKARPSA